MITPIELMRKLNQYSKHVYMLESHEDKNKWGRYTFIGFDPKSEITCYNKMMKVDDKILKVTHTTQSLLFPKHIALLLSIKFPLLYAKDTIQES